MLAEQLTKPSKGVLGVLVLLLVFTLRHFLFITQVLSLTLVHFSVVLFFTATSLTLGGSRLTARLVTIFGSLGMNGVVTAPRA